MAKILVTGGAGYVGAHFVNRLKGHEIVVVENFCQGKHNILDSVDYVALDIRDKEGMIDLFERIKPDMVLHFAALSKAEDSIVDPDTYYDNNVIGTLNVLEAMRKVGCNKIIFSSSGSVYGEGETTFINEEHPKNPTSVYGYTKIVCEQILKDYHRAYGINSISFRYFCASGCDEKLGCFHRKETRVIPNIVKTMLGKQPMFYLYGTDYNTPDGTAIHDYVHVNDLADAHILAMDHLDKPVCEVFNLGTNKGYSVMELIKEAEKAIGQKLNYEVKPKRIGDTSDLVADATKAQRYFKWKPKYEIGEIIKSDYNFFKSI